jgi:hypothetical protein
VSIAALVVVGAGAPLLFVGAIAATSRLTCGGDFDCAVGMFTFATSGYRLWYWEGVAMLQKALVVICVAVVPTGMMQLVAPMWVVAAMLAARDALQPWDEAFVHRVEGVSHRAIVVTYGLLALTFVDGVASSSAALTAVVALAAAVNLASFAVFLHAIVWGMRRTLRDLADEDGSYTAVYDSLFEPSVASLREKQITLRHVLKKVSRRLHRHAGEFFSLQLELLVKGRYPSDVSRSTPNWIRLPSSPDQKWRSEASFGLTDAARVHGLWTCRRRAAQGRRANNERRSDNGSWERSLSSHDSPLQEAIEGAFSTWSSDRPSYSLEPGPVFFDEVFFDTAAAPESRDVALTVESVRVELSTWSSEVVPMSIEPGSVFLEDDFFVWDVDPGEFCGTAVDQLAEHPFFIADAAEIDSRRYLGPIPRPRDGYLRPVAHVAAGETAAAGQTTPRQRGFHESVSETSTTRQTIEGKSPAFERIVWAVAKYRWITTVFLHDYAHGVAEEQLCRELSRLLSHRNKLVNLWLETKQQQIRNVSSR